MTDAVKPNERAVTDRRASRAARLAGAFLGLVLLTPHVATAQCAMCRRALQSPEGRQILGAFQSSTLLLVIAPFAVFGTIAVLAVRAQRRRAHEAWRPDALPVDR